MIKRLTGLWLLILTVQAWPAVAEETFSNPIISGFAPDPSIVRVESDFYLVNSTFELFPGIPVYHSRDLVNWELISYALHNPEQVDLDVVDSSGGVHASTIRYHEGTFYVITTNVLHGQPINFIVTAMDPRGPWSPAHVLEGAPGIDPSLFFDDDGRAWYTGNHQPPDPDFPGQAEIWLQEVDLERMQLIGERHFLWRGCCQGEWAEGPHLYKRDGYYYLLISEGGTSYDHALSVAISENVTGPYANIPRNPVLTHRHLSYDHPITGVGHADLVELADGRWYAVALGWRLVNSKHGILGRETFLLPVSWESERRPWKEAELTFPVFSPASGRVELHFPLPFEGMPQAEESSFSDEFDGAQLGLEWNFRRTPNTPYHSLVVRPGALRLSLQPTRIGENAVYSFAGVRQRHFEFEAATEMRFAPGPEEEEAGLVAIQNDRSAYLLTLSGAGGETRLQLRQSFKGEDRLLAGRPWAHAAAHLKVTGNYLDYRFFVSADGQDWQPLGEAVDGRYLSPAILGGFNYTGVYIGLYASSNGAPGGNHADFEAFAYRPLVTERDAWYHRQAAGN